MTKVKKIEIILNKRAGNGQSLRTYKTVKKFLDSAKIHYQLHTTKKDGDGIRIAEYLADHITDEYTRILVIGGDGTLNQALNGIKQSTNPNLALGYIPAGSGNDFSRGINIKNKKPEILLQEFLAMNTPRIIDIGKATSNLTTKYFVNNIGIGFDASTVYHTNHSKRKNILNKLKLGTLAYASSLVKVIKLQKPFPLTVTYDNKVKHFDDAYIVTATNHPYFGGGIAIDPLANPFDQKLDLVVVKVVRGTTFVRLFKKLLTDGSHLNDPKVWHIQSKNFELNSFKPEHGQMDGEELDTQEFSLNFEVAQHAFWIPIKNNN